MNSGKCSAILINNRVIVPDYDCSNKLYWDGFFGGFFGVYKPREKKVESILELSLIEALYLVEKGLINVVKGGEQLSYRELMEVGRSLIKDFDTLYKVYKDLRDRGFIVRRGLKFGCHYLVYKFGPGIDHAPFGVEVQSVGNEYDPIIIVRLGRLLHSVKKKLIVAIDSGNKLDYVLFSWWKP